MKKLKVFVATIPVVVVLLIVILLVCNIESEGLRFFLSIVLGLVAGLGILKYSKWLDQKIFRCMKKGEDNKCRGKIS